MLSIFPITRRLAALLLVVTMCLNASFTAATTYTMTAFTNKSESNMYVYESDDGSHYALIKGPAFTPPKGLIRDPSIIRHTDGKYWVTYTTDWSAKTIGFAVSSDREHWTFSHNYTIPVANLTESWAPEWFIDRDGSVNIVVSLRKSTDNGNFTPSLITAQNGQFTAWSAPVALRGLSPNYIDTFVTKVGSTYHAMVKNETTKFIEYATATTLTGPWTFKGTGNWAGWSSGNEGPSLLKLDNNNWRILFDCYSCNPKKYYYSDSTDFKTWTTKAELPGGLSGFVRHLTVLKEIDPATSDYVRLQSYSFPNYYLGHVDFNGSIDDSYVNAQDSRWKIVPGLADTKGISLQ
ncbi:MAG TPA: AbfB domain-containing protein, partial [Cellvibrionaceae bacterium]